MNTTTCEACGASIFFPIVRRKDGSVPINPTTGKPVRSPVNERPDPVGTLVLVAGGEDSPVMRRLSKAEAERPATVDRYVSHFATCTQPERFRRRGTSSRFNRGRARSGGQR